MSKILLNSTNAEYHSDRTSLSSSNLKLLLTDPARFHREWVLNQAPPQEQRAVFDEGSYVHSLILEPDKVSQYAIFNGLRKAGKAFEDFVAANPGKIILTAPQVNRCKQLANSYGSLPVATKMLEKGIPEFTMLSEILGVPVKARADWINIEEGYIVDVKTTSAVSDLDVFRMTCEQYKYALSAALYCQIAFNNFGKLFDFYFIVLSKADMCANVYKASSDFLTYGASQVTQALVTYNKCKESGIWSLEQPKTDFSTKEYEIYEV